MSDGEKVIPRYPKAKHIRDRHCERIFDSEVVVQEKLDGSQFSFMVNEHGTLFARSKNAMREVHAPDPIFEPAIRWLRQNKDKLLPGFVYRAECFKGDGHNVLEYENVPEQGFVVYDVQYQNGDFLKPQTAKAHCENHGIPYTEIFSRGQVMGETFSDKLEKVKGFLDEESFLGGPTIEGVVVKNYEIPGPYSPIIVGKVVRDDFKERLHKEWEDKDQSPSDIRDQLAQTINKEARWRKVVQHAEEDGKLEGEPSDLAELFPDLREDLREEEGDRIKEELFEWAFDHIFRSVKSGFPEWYKDSLIERETNENGD